MKHKFPYCPNCKSSENEFVNNHKFICKDCDYVFFKNVASSVAVVLIKNNKVLFTVRNMEPKKGFLDLPGGFVDPRETGEETCKREIKEELSIDLELSKIEYVASIPNDYWYKDTLYHTLDLFYKAEVPLNCEFSLEKEEISEIQWIALEDLNLAKIGFDSMKRFFREKLIH